MSLHNLQNIIYNPVTDFYKITFYLWQDWEQVQVDSYYPLLGREDENKIQ